MIRASVIVCAYTEKRWDDLLAAVQSIRGQETPPGEILVVIDHNPVLLERARRALEAPGTRVLPNAQERGLSGARNTGIAAAQGAVLVFIDEDAAAAPGWLAALLAPYAQPGVAGVGGAILPWWVAGKPAWFPEEFNWVVGCTYRGMPEQAAPVRNLIGANMSFRREVFEAVGGFESGMGRVGTLPYGCEETELCIRATRARPGEHFLFEPGAVVRHKVPPARATWRYFVSRCFAEGISKAQVAHRVGAGRGLASERAYTLRALPLGFARGLGDFLRRGDRSGLGRAAAIVLGLGVTAAGYLYGSALRGGRPPADPAIATTQPDRPPAVTG